MGLGIGSGGDPWNGRICREYICIKYDLFFHSERVVCFESFGYGRSQFQVRPMHSFADSEYGDDCASPIAKLQFYAIYVVVEPPWRNLHRQYHFSWESFKNLIYFLLPLCNRSPPASDEF